jgi:signal transduction histidine kinase
LVASLAVIAIGVYGNFHLNEVFPGLLRTPTVLLFPLFFWAAARFGVGGVSTSLLVAALAASISTASGARPYVTLPPLESLAAIQLYLTVMSIPLMCLAGVLAERRQSASDLAARLRFEALVSELAASFIRPAQPSHPSAFEAGLARVGTFWHADLVLLATPDATGQLRCRHWCRESLGDERTALACTTLASAVTGDDAPDMLVFDSLAGIPADVRIDPDGLAALNLHAAVVVRFRTRSNAHGALTVAAFESRAWSNADLAHIRLLTEVLSNAWAREEAEFEVQEARHELAKAARVLSMAALTSSLAHEINQPLTAILSNAQAGARVLADDTPALADVRAIIADIVDDTRRASRVIERLRDMVARHSGTSELLDLNVAVRDVAALLSSEAIVRNVTVTLAFMPEPLLVRAVRIELQHAILNVLNEALRIAAGAGVSTRSVAVRLESETIHAHSGDRYARIVIRLVDESLSTAGASLRTSALTVRLTERESSLAVARTTLEAHGGVVSAVSDGRGRCDLIIALPQVEVGAAV